jgi:hypothetical protein
MLFYFNIIVKCLIVTETIQLFLFKVIVHFNYFWNFRVFFWLNSLRTSSYIVSHQSNLVQMKIFLTL